MVNDRTSLHSLRVIWDCSPIRKIAFSLLFLFDVIVEFGPSKSGKVSLNQIKRDGLLTPRLFPS